MQRLKERLFLGYVRLHVQQRKFRGDSYEFGANPVGKNPTPMPYGLVLMLRPNDDFNNAVRQLSEIAKLDADFYTVNHKKTCH
jgi:hypothetical protein